MRIVNTLVIGSLVLGFSSLACSATSDSAPTIDEGTGGGATATATGSWSCEAGFDADQVCDCGCNADDAACNGNGCAEPGCYAAACEYCYDGTNEIPCDTSSGSGGTGGGTVTPTTGGAGGGVTPTTGGTSGGTVTPPAGSTTVNITSISVTGCAAQATYNLASGTSGFVANDEGSSITGISLEGGTMTAPFSGAGQYAQIQLPFEPAVDMTGCSLAAQVSLGSAGSCSTVGVVLWFYDGTQLIQPWDESVGAAVPDPITAGNITFSPAGANMSTVGAIGINFHCQ